MTGEIGIDGRYSSISGRANIRRDKSSGCQMGSGSKAGTRRPSSTSDSFQFNPKKVGKLIFEATTMVI